MTITIRQWLLLAVLIFLAILFYTIIIIPYWTYILFPIFKYLSYDGAKLQLETAIIIILMDFAGALTIAALLSIPLGYITKDRAIYSGFLLGLGLLLYIVWLHLHIYQEPWWSTFNTVIVIFNYIGIIIAFIFMSKVGAYIRRHRERKTTEPVIYEKDFQAK
jgi:hypothetical protein